MVSVEFISRYIDVLNNGLGVLTTLDMDSILQMVGCSSMVVTAGNGGSSATASHMANDMTKMARIPTICLTDSVPLLTAYSNDYSYRDALARYYNDIPLPRDTTLIVYSGSGESENIVTLVWAALTSGHGVLAVTGYSGNTLASMDVTSMCFEVGDIQVAEDLALVFSHILVRLLGE